MQPARLEQTLLGLDFGLRKIGVAIGNTLTGRARALTILESTTRQRRFEQLAALFAQWQPDRVVVGLPLAKDGSEQHISRQARRFANQLRGRFGVEVELVDERGSSLEAQKMVRAGEPDDAMAAAVILQRYLDHLSPDGGERLAGRL